jgi:hypothetical protein
MGLLLSSANVGCCFSFSLVLGSGGTEPVTAESYYHRDEAGTLRIKPPSEARSWALAPVRRRPRSGLGRRAGLPTADWVTLSSDAVRDMGAARALDRIIARLGLPINLIVAAPCTENLPGGQATKPGDVVTSMSGKTVEVINTDAEGRLVLIDGVTYVERAGAHRIIDVATLSPLDADTILASGIEEYLFDQLKDVIRGLYIHYPGPGDVTGASEAGDTEAAGDTGTADTSDAEGDARVDETTTAS